MDRMEERLREALRRQEAPEGFAARVLARAAGQQQLRREAWWQRWFAMPRLRWAAAALCVVMMGGVWMEHERRQRAGEAAKRQVMMALHLASSKAQLATEKVQQLSER